MCVYCVHTGIIPWGPRVQEIGDIGRSAIQQIRTSVRTPLVSLLLRGQSFILLSGLRFSIREPQLPRLRIGPVADTCTSIASYMYNVIRKEIAMHVHVHVLISSTSSSNDIVQVILDVVRQH